MSSHGLLLDARVGAMLHDLALAPKARRGGGWTIELPSERRGAIGVGIRARERTVRMATFLMRAPDREREAVYRRMLERNLQMAYWRLGLDPDGDLYLAAHLDEPQLSTDGLDAVLGLLVTYVDEMYEGLVRLGFAIPANARLSGPPTAPEPPDA